MGSVITYDVSDKQSEVKSAMLGLGYNDHWVYEGAVYNLPDTTLWHQAVSREDALQHLLGVAAVLQVTVERAVVFDSLPWTGLRGQTR
jgi:hypothetical protein